MDDEKRCRGVGVYPISINFIFLHAREPLYIILYYIKVMKIGYTPTPVQSLSFLFDKAVAIGVEQFFEVSYLALQVFTLVCVGYQHPVGTHLYDLRG